MKSTLLLPHKFKIPGWLIMIPAAIVGLVQIFSSLETISINAPVFAIYSDEIFGKAVMFNIIHTNIANTIIGALFIIGALMVAFSKEKQEDEFISGIRQSSLLWAVLVNYLLLLFAFLFIYGTPFLSIMLYNMFTVLIIFIARFHYVLFRNSKYSEQ